MFTGFLLLFYVRGLGFFFVVFFLFFFETPGKKNIEVKVSFLFL